VKSSIFVKIETQRLQGSSPNALYYCSSSTEHTNITLG
jgi:hypothetical protein